MLKLEKMKEKSIVHLSIYTNKPYAGLDIFNKTSSIMPITVII
jgi:hypothetical protein